MRRSPLHRSVLACSIIAVNAGLLGTTPSFAQGQSMVLEEIIVTARKRQESIQDVPISMAAFSGEQLRDSGITNVKNLTMQVPGLQIDDQSTAQIWIRGVGQRDDSARIDSPVGVYIDGVYIARKDAQLLDILDAESIQILRGPQGTLFGKNTTAGALVVNTRKPNENLGGYVEGRVGNYKRRDAKAVLNLPLIDNTLYSKVTLSSVKRDGYMKNIITDQDMSSEDRLNAALQLRWLPVDNVSVDTFVYYNKTREVSPGANCKPLYGSGYNGEDPMYQNQMWPGDTTLVNSMEGQGLDAATLSAMLGVPVNEVSQAYRDACLNSYALLKKDKLANNHKQSFELDNLLMGVTVDWEINDQLSFKSITGYGDQRLGGVSNYSDNDATGMLMTSRPRISPSDRDQFSQEFQFTGSALDERFQYTAGVFGMVENIDDGTTYQFGAPNGLLMPLGANIPNDLHLVLSPPTVQHDTYDLKNTTYAAFFQGSYDITEDLQFTLGVRWTSEKRETRLDQRLLDEVDFYTRVGTAAFMGQIPGFNMVNIGGRDIPTINIADLGSDPFSAIDALFPMTAAGYKDYTLTPAQRHKASKTWTKVNPMASLSYTLPHDLLRDSFVDSAMAYITYAEGFKSGTFEPFGASGLRPVDPEVVKNHEIGLKLDGFDRRVRLNLAAYYMKYDDMQLRQVEYDDRPVVVLANASKSEIKGAELELTWQPTAGLLVNLGGSYNRYKFKSFDDKQLSTAALLARSDDMPAVDRSKETFPEVPKKTFNFGVQYDWVTDFGTIRPRVDYYYRSEVYLGLDAGAWNARRDSTVGSAGLVNARLAWVSPKQDWEIAAWGTNLTDKTHFHGAAAVGDSIGSVTLQKSPPRMYGVELLYRFVSY